MGGLATKSAVARCALAAVLTTTACGSKDDVSAETTPIHLSIAGHIEDQKSYTDCSFYRSKRAQLLQFAQALSAYPVSFNLQASYEWFVGALNCEDDKTRQSTGGLNIIDYLADEFGFEIDIHQEGASLDHTSSGNNFADIRFIGGQVTSRISDTTGFQWDNPDHYASFQEGAYKRGLHGYFRCQVQPVAHQPVGHQPVGHR